MAKAENKQKNWIFLLSTVHTEAQRFLEEGRIYHGVIRS